MTNYTSEQLPKKGFRALIHLCQFFLDNVDKKLHKPDLILEQSVQVLLRMVFILMAEDKTLLPIGNPNYGCMSLMALAYDLWDQDISPKPSGTELWKRLHTLFTTLQEGHSGLNIPSHGWTLFHVNSLEEAMQGNANVDRHDVVGCIAPLLTDKTPGSHEGCLLGFDGIHPHHLGDLYEHMLCCVPNVVDGKVQLRLVNHNKKKDKENDKKHKDKQRQQGVYYTPPEVIHLMVNILVK